MGKHYFYDCVCFLLLVLCVGVKKKKKRNALKNVEIRMGVREE